MWQDEKGQVLTLRKKTYSGDRRHNVLHTERIQWSLEIRDVKPDDLGVYTCVVSTKPFLTRTVTLREGKPGEGVDKVPEIGQSTGSSPQLVRDTFREDVHVKQYQAVTLTCQFTGDPTPTIKWERRMWTRDGVKVVEDLKTDGETYTLTNAQMEDTGVYVCRASNGSPPPVQGLIRVKVREVMTTTTPLPTTTTFDPIDDAAPRAYSFGEVVYQHLGRDAELTCKAVGIPRPTIQWRVDGDHIQDNYKYTIREQQYRHHTLHSALLVKSVHPGNFKKYECYVFNKYGDDRTTIVLAENRNP
ncbi:lachesin-like [Littorina saxatilis]|uniref:Ig-like domain-containing protein n=1 Tax=Littorina saxatilis TaxID=31220 RepID=A0AAN9GQ13_9CAEN